MNYSQCLKMSLDNGIAPLSLFLKSDSEIRGQLYTVSNLGVLGGNTIQRAINTAYEHTGFTGLQFLSQQISIE